jgi:hypothetical protein
MQAPLNLVLLKELIVNFTCTITPDIFKALHGVCCQAFYVHTRARSIDIDIVLADAKLGV